MEFWYEKEGKYEMSIIIIKLQRDVKNELKKNNLRKKNCLLLNMV